MDKNEYQFYVDKGICNGIGGEGGRNFSDLLRNDLQWLDEYDREKGYILIEEIERDLASYHDIAYWLGTSIIKKWKADIIFSYGVFKKLWWIKYRFVRYTAFFAILIGLLWKGNKYYNFKEKRILPKYELGRNLV